MADSVPITPAPGSSFPPNISANRLDNPPRTRVISAVQAVSTNPFNGLSFIDLLNIRVAMRTHMNNLLAENSATNADHVVSTKRVLGLIAQKLSPASSAPAARPMPIPLPPSKP